MTAVRDRFRFDPPARPVVLRPPDDPLYDTANEAERRAAATLADDLMLSDDPTGPLLLRLVAQAQESERINAGLIAENAALRRNARDGAAGQALDLSAVPTADIFREALDRARAGEHP